MGAQNSNVFFFSILNLLTKISIRSKNNVPIKCLLPLFWASEREEQEGIRFGGAAMEIFKSTIVQKQFALNKNHFYSPQFYLPLFVGSESAQQEGIRFGGSGMQINYNFASRFGLQQNCIDEI